MAALRDAANRSGNGAGLAQAQAQLHNLAQLQKQVGSADIIALAGLRTEVNATVAVAQSVARQAQGTDATAQNAQAALYEADQQARRTATDFMHDFYDKHKFDKYLHFADAKDEEEYRKREAKYHEEIEKALAEHTPEGDLRALKLEQEQIRDAGAHGADKSRDYKSTLRSLHEKETALSSAIGGEKSAQLSKDAKQPSAPDNVTAMLRDAGVSLAADDAPQRIPASGKNVSQGTGRGAPGPT